ncbi:MAG: hypothetical protein ACQGVC_03165 [Myxococcota bacterium]
MNGAGDPRIAISYSLFGGAADWRNRGVTAYARGVELVWRAWRLLLPRARILVFLHPDSVPRAERAAVERIARSGGVELFLRGASQGRSGALWRFEPIWWNDLDAVFFRDLDSLPTLDELANMRFFLDSGRALHLYRARFHWKLWLAGLSGVRPRAVRARFRDAQAFWGDGDFRRYGSEERRLRELARAFPEDVVEAPQSVWLRDSLVPDRARIRRETPPVPGYPRVAFAGMRLGERRIEALLRRLRALEEGAASWTPRATTGS